MGKITLSTHRFREGRGHSFYECLRKFGLEWFGSRGFFEQRKLTGQSLWMDLALARRSGQELRNKYTITGSPDFAPLRRFFKSAVHQLQVLYTGVCARLVSSTEHYTLSDRHYERCNLRQLGLIGQCNYP